MAAICPLQNFMYQLLKGVAHCHKHGVMHRDLKPQNLLVDDATNTLKIADLGLGRAFSVPIKSYTHEVIICPLHCSLTGSPSAHCQLSIENLLNRLWMCRSLRCGIVLQRYCLAQRIMHLVLTSGQLPAFLPSLFIR